MTLRSSHSGCFQLKEERLPETTDLYIFGSTLFFLIQGEAQLQTFNSVHLCHAQCSRIGKRKSLAHLKSYPLKLLVSYFSTSYIFSYNHMSLSTMSEKLCFLVNRTTNSGYEVLYSWTAKMLFILNTQLVTHIKSTACLSEIRSPVFSFTVFKACFFREKQTQSAIDICPREGNHSSFKPNKNSPKDFTCKKGEMMYLHADMYILEEK